MNIIQRLVPRIQIITANFTARFCGNLFESAGKLFKPLQLLFKVTIKIAELNSAWQLVISFAERYHSQGFALENKKRRIPAFLSTTMWNAEYNQAFA